MAAVAELMRTLSKPAAAAICGLTYVWPMPLLCVLGLAACFPLCVLGHFQRTFAWSQCMQRQKKNRRTPRPNMCTECASLHSSINTPHNLHTTLHLLLLLYFMIFCTCRSPPPPSCCGFASSVKESSTSPPSPSEYKVRLKCVRLTVMSVRPK